jgi:hypothetical protein
MSRVDAVIRAVNEDTNVAIAPMLTFNGRDSNDVCRQHSVEMP